MLIEQQYYVTNGNGEINYGPPEYYPAEWAAIRAAVDKGIVLVEAGANPAANGQLDIDAVH